MLQIKDWRYEKILTLLIRFGMLLGIPSLPPDANEVAREVSVTLSNVMDVLQRYDADGAFILQYATGHGEDVMFWGGNSDSLGTRMEL